MKNISLNKIAIIGFFFISILGTLSHFVYEWSQNNILIGALFAVNESVWEHLKIIIIPSFVWLVIEYFIRCEKVNFFTSKIISFITSMILIISVFYGYRLIINKDVLIINIISFYFSIGVGQYLSYKIMKCRKFPSIVENISKVLLVLLFISFIIFTYITPKLELFRNPPTNGYGIEDSKKPHLIKNKCGFMYIHSSKYN